MDDRELMMLLRADVDEPDAGSTAEVRRRVASRAGELRRFRRRRLAVAAAVASGLAFAASTAVMSRDGETEVRVAEPPQGERVIALSDLPPEDDGRRRTELLAATAEVDEWGRSTSVYGGRVVVRDTVYVGFTENPEDMIVEARRRTSVPPQDVVGFRADFTVEELETAAADLDERRTELVAQGVFIQSIVVGDRNRVAVQYEATTEEDAARQHQRLVDLVPYGPLLVLSYSDDPPAQPASGSSQRPGEAEAA